MTPRLLRSPLALGSLLVVATLAAMLAAAAANRSGGPVVRLEVTERELAMPLYRADLGTPLELELRLGNDTPWWQIHPDTPEARSRAFVYPWLGPDKLRSLGFDVHVDTSAAEAAGFYRSLLPRRAFVALEMEGDVSSDRSIPARSRLFAVDASLHASDLATQSGGPRATVVMEGVVFIRLQRPESGEPFLTGRVALAVPSVQVPAALRGELEPFRSGETQQQFYERVRKNPDDGMPPRPRYRAVLAFGRRHAAWIESIARLESAPAADEPSPP